MIKRLLRATRDDAGKALNAWGYEDDMIHDFCLIQANDKNKIELC